MTVLPKFLQARGRPRLVQALGYVVFACAALTQVAPALAAAVGPPPPPPPPPTTTGPSTTSLALPGPNLTDSNGQLASHQTLFDLGSNFLRRQGNQSTWGANAAAAYNPGGGGASESSAPQTFRSWAEFYGISARNDAQDDFTGDRRKTFGGVAGIGATVLPGLNVGMSVDQSNTRIDMPLVLQSAKLGLTQLGFNASYAVGPWTLAAVVVHGWGMINSQRDTTAGLATSNYRGRVDGALAELSYYWAFGQARIVPKLGVEYVRAETDAFQEFGGYDPVASADASGERARVLIGAEVGHYWILDRHVFDMSAYGKFVDNVVQNLSPIAVSANGQTVTVQGIRESTYGADTGASMSLGLTDAVRLYANYDGRYRANATSQQGTVGLEVRW